MSSLHRLGRARGRFGVGGEAELPPHVPVRYNSFAGGYNVSDVEEDVAEQSSPDCLDMEVNYRDSLIKAPGTLVYELFDVDKTPRQIALFVGLSLAQEIILFDPPLIGVKKDAVVNTLWMSTTTPPETQEALAFPYFWTTFADSFIFANTVGLVRSHLIGSDVVVDEPLIPNGSTFAVVAARLFVGGAVIEGIKQPMVVAWSGIGGYSKFDYVNDLGSGFEPLIADQSSGDSIVAIRAMGLDMAAIICRNSVWVGRRTGDLDRPIDFQPRITGKGCIAESTVRTVQGGVIYLGSEGVELFDGNVSHHVSLAIDDDLLPINYLTIANYNSAYDSSTQRYFLFTPSATFVYDLNRGRWYKRSLIALGGVPFSESLPASSWNSAELASLSWVDGYDTWLSAVGKMAELPIMTFLGQDTALRYAIHKEDYVSYTNFLAAFKPRWQSVLGESPFTGDLVTTDTINIRYKQGGSVDLYLPNLSSVLTKITPVPLNLPVDSLPTLRKKRTVFTGLEAGWKMEFISGTPEISEVELRVLPRGPRLAAPDPCDNSGLSGIQTYGDDFCVWRSGQYDAFRINQLTNPKYWLTHTMGASGFIDTCIDEDEASPLLSHADFEKTLLNNSHMMLRFDRLLTDTPAINWGGQVFLRQVNVPPPTNVPVYPDYFQRIVCEFSNGFELRNPGVGTIEGMRLLEGEYVRVDMWAQDAGVVLRWDFSKPGFTHTNWNTPNLIVTHAAFRDGTPKEIIIRVRDETNTQGHIEVWYGPAFGQLTKVLNLVIPYLIGSPFILQGKDYYSFMEATGSLDTVQVSGAKHYGMYEWEVGPAGNFANASWFSRLGV